MIMSSLGSVSLPESDNFMQGDGADGSGSGAGGDLPDDDDDAMRGSGSGDGLDKGMYKLHSILPVMSLFIFIPNAKKSKYLCE